MTDKPLEQPAETPKRSVDAAERMPRDQVRQGSEVFDTKPKRVGFVAYLAVAVGAAALVVFIAFMMMSGGG